MGEVIDFFTYLSILCAKRAGRVVTSTVLWAAFFQDILGAQRVAFEAILVEDRLPPNCLQDMEVALANFHESRRARLFLPSLSLLQGQEGLLHLCAASGPLPGFVHEAPTTLSLMAGEQYLVYPLPWVHLNEAAPRTGR